MVSRIAQLEEIPSISGSAAYNRFRISSSIVNFTRVDTGEQWNISLDELYNAYLYEPELKTTNFKKHVTNRTQSPACAILLAIGAYDKNRQRL